VNIMGFHAIRKAILLGLFEISFSPQVSCEPYFDNAFKILILLRSLKKLEARLKSFQGLKKGFHSLGFIHRPCFPRFALNPEAIYFSII